MNNLHPLFKNICESFTSAFYYNKLENIEFDGINYNDAPDFCDAFICYAEINGKPLTDAELELLNDDSDYVYELLMDKIY
jgi:hypothetical protein